MAILSWSWKELKGSRLMSLNVLTLEVGELSNRKEMEALFLKRGFKDFRWINPQKIVTSHWVRIKCMFAAGNTGRTPAVLQTRYRLLNPNASWTIMVKQSSSILRSALKNQKIVTNGREVSIRSFWNLNEKCFWRGIQRRFLLFMDSCSFCENCTWQRATCQNKRFARPTPEAMTIDVFSQWNCLGVRSMYCVTTRKPWTDTPSF